MRAAAAEAALPRQRQAAPGRRIHCRSGASGGLRSDNRSDHQSLFLERRARRGDKPHGFISRREGSQGPRIDAAVRFVGILAFVFVLLGRAAIAQPNAVQSPSPAPTPAPALLPAGVIPASLSLDVTGTPAIDADVLNAQILAALDRQIRPTLRPGASVRYGPIVPWPLLPLASGARAAVDVTVTIDGDTASTDATGVTSVTLNNIVVPPALPSVLFLSDDPEYLQTEGLVFRGDIAAGNAARLYYYQSDIGVPRDLDVVLTSAVPTRVQLIDAAAGPELDVMDVGHSVSRDFLRFEQSNEGTIVDVEPGRPFIVRHALIIGGEVAAGAVDLHVLNGGGVGVSVVASPAGGRPDAYLNGPRVPLDGHGRHGVFALDGFGNIAQSYTVGGPGAAVKYGGRTTTPTNLDPRDLGHDFGDYGIVHRIAFTLINPTDTPRLVYLYEKPLAGPVRSSFYIDGQLKDLGCVRMQQPYWITTYQLAPHTTGLSTTLTMPDGGSFYPLEFGVSETQPLPYTPLVGTADGCSPNVTRVAQ